MRPNAVHLAFDKSHSSPWEIYIYEGGKKIRLARAKTKREALVLRARYQRERNLRGIDAPSLSLAQIDEYLRAKKALGSDISLDVVVADFLGRTQKPSIALADAKNAFMAQRKEEGLAAVSIQDYQGKLDALEREFPKLTVEFFAQPPQGADPHPLPKFILDVSEDAQTRIHYRVKLGTFFTWCMKRRWLSAHPNQWVQLAVVIRKTPQIYSPEVAAHNPFNRTANSISIDQLIAEIGIAPTGEKIRPDLVDRATSPWEVYEIKPDTTGTGLKRAGKQLDQYIDAFGRNNVLAVPGMSYVPPPVIPSPPFYSNIRITSRLEAPGIILYDLEERLSLSQQAVIILITSAAIQAAPAKNALVQQANTIASEAEEAGIADVEATVDVAFELETL